MDPYLEYWTQRIRSGLGMSAVGMGDGNGAHRATAQTAVGESQTTTIKFQQTLKAYIDPLLDELLYEAGWTEHTLREEDRVRLFIPEIDLENKIKQENHEIQKWTQNTATLDEARVSMGMEVLSPEEEKRLFAFMISAAVDEMKQNKAVENKDKPTNQHGTQGAKPKVAKD